MEMSRKAAGLLVLAVLVAGLPSNDPAIAQSGSGADSLCDTSQVEQFTDVAGVDYGSAYVLCMRALGLSQGIGGGNYGPDRELNRGQMASFLVRLWRDVLGNDCPAAVVTPFTDVSADSTHAANIDCLYGLEITAGTGPDTYGPRDPLKATQISRFLYRTYRKAGGNSCAGSGGSELDRAAECLVRLRVVPTSAEARATAAVTRAQMGVYMVGLWHNLSGRGLPPPPPQLDTATTEQRQAERVFAEIADAEAYMVQLVNELRESVGSPVLESHPGLADVARAWSGEMAAGDFVHNPDWRTQYPDGWTAGGENIAHVSSPRPGLERAAVDIAFEGLSDSPGHYANMISKLFSHIGVGIVDTGGQVYFTQNFACYPPDDQTTRCYEPVTVTPTQVFAPDAVKEPILLDAECGGEVSLGTYTAIDPVVNANRPDIWALGTDGTIQCLLAGTPVPSGRFSSISSGDSYTACAIRADKTLACWSWSVPWYLNPVHAPPAGEFSAVSVGNDHMCALRVSGSVVCWGVDDAGETDAPGGVFKAVTAGDTHSCGLRSDSTVVCWGDSRLTRSPSGEFASIDAGSIHSCGVRTDGNVTCWGEPVSEVGDVPEGTFTTVNAGNGTSCGVRADGAIECWGRGWGNSRRFAATPKGTFTQLSMGFDFDCGLRTDRRIVCWGHNQLAPYVNRDGSDFKPVSSLGLTKLSRGANHRVGCGIRTDKSAVCWTVDWPDYRAEILEVSGEYTDVATTGLFGPSVTCFLRTDGRVLCHGNDRFTELVDHSKNIKFVALVTPVYSYEPAACGIASDGTLTCWGDPDQSVTKDVPGGTFATVDMARNGTESYACAIHTNGSLVCWGGVPQPPSGTYTDLSVSDSTACALRTDHNVVCWSWTRATGSTGTSLYTTYRGIFVNEPFIHSGGFFPSKRKSVFEPPEGLFKSVTTGPHYACALRRDGSADCWGDYQYLEPYALEGSFVAIEGQCGLRVDSAIVCRALLLPEGVAWSRYPVHCRTFMKGASSETPSLCVLDLEESSDTDVQWGASESTNYPTVSIANYPRDYIESAFGSPRLCWIVIDRWAYDVTPREDGYEYTGPGSILDHCGTDATHHFLSNDIELPDLEFLRGSVR